MSDGRVWKIAGVGVFKLARVGDGWAPQRVGPSHRPRGWVRLQVRVQTQGRPHGGAEASLKAIGRTRLPKENHLQCNPGPHKKDKLTPPCGLESILPVHSFATGREQRTRMEYILPCTHEQPQAISMQYLVTILVLLYVNVCKCK